MKNLESLKAHLDTLPDDIRSKAKDLIERMETTLEGIGDAGVEWRAPLLKLLQATSDKTGLPRGTPTGSLILNEEVQPAPMDFIPLRVYDGRQLWDPDMNNRKMLCQSPDALKGQIGVDCKTCRHSQWIEGQGSDCQKVRTVVAIKADLSEVFTMNFSKSSYSVGMDFQNTLRKAGVSPYARTYTLSSETSPKTKTVEQFKIEALAADKRKTPDSILPFVKELFDVVSADRKALIEAFYKSIEERRAAGQLPNGVAGMPAIEDQSSGDATLALPSETAEAAPVKAGAKTKSYQV